jgi:lysophospholipase L1-like esterase
MDTHLARKVMVAVRFTLSVADYINKHSVSSVFRIDLLSLEVIVQEQRCLSLHAHAGVAPGLSVRDHSDVAVEVVHINLDGNMNKVTIYLPWSYQTKIARITLDDNCMVWKTAKKPKSIICMGDSITQGYMADNPTQTYVGRLSTHLDAEVINQGNGGYFLDYELLDEFINIKPSLVTFAYGTNDYSRNGNPEVIRDNLDDFLDNLTEIFTKTPVLCITAPYRGSEKHFNRENIIGWGYDKLREIFHEVCSKYSQVTVIDDPVPHDEACFFTDYTHPTALGFEHYFNNIYPTVKELLG